MALLLSAFLMHGFTPGPEMLTKHLDVTYAIIWTLTISHLMGAIVCLCASGLFARLVLIRIGLLVPAVLAIIFLGAFNGSQSWGDLYSMVIFGIVGWVMKQLGWPRPPLILGLVLGSTFERYLFISNELYGMSMFARPIVVVVLAIALWIILFPVFKSARRIVNNLSSTRPVLGAPRMSWNAVFAGAVLLVVGGAISQTEGWQAHARLVPLTSAYAALLLGLGVLVTELFSGRPAKVVPVGGHAGHMDAAALDFSQDNEAPGTLRNRAIRFFCWLGALLAVMTAIGLLPGLFLVMFGLAALEFRERWWVALLLSVGMTLGFWLVFGRIFATPWPEAAIGNLLPRLREVTGLV